MEAVHALEQGVGGASMHCASAGAMGASSNEESSMDEERAQQHDSEEEEQEEQGEWTDEDGEFGGMLHEPSRRGGVKGWQGQGVGRGRGGGEGWVGDDSSRECSDEEGCQGSEEGEDRPVLRFELSSDDDAWELGGADGEGDGEEEAGASAAHRAAAPFFGPPPKAFRVELSPFNFVWSLLSAWITRDTLAYLTSSTLEPSLAPLSQHPAASPPHKQQQQHAPDDASIEADGEARALAVLAACGEAGGGAEKKPQPQAPPSSQALQAHAALAVQLEPYVHSTLDALHARASVSEVSKRVTHVLCTFIFPGPVPSLSAPQCRLLALALLRALAMRRLPVLAEAFEGPGAGAHVVRALQGEQADAGAPQLAAAPFSLPHLSALVDLLLHD